MITKNPKLKYVHIGEDVWACGAVKNNHMVIYAPNRKQYDVYGKDIKYHRCVYRHGNTAIESNLKIYILTSILDKRENWIFDLNLIPNVNELKIIYDNGTIKNIVFHGVFEPKLIPKKYDNGKGERVPYTTKLIKPVGYRYIKDVN